MSACRDELLLIDSQEFDEEENTIPTAGNSNELNIQEVDDERESEAEGDESGEDGEDDDLFHVPSRKRKLISPV